jgi:hypothetical protein
VGPLGVIRRQIAGKRRSERMGEDALCWWS